MRWLGSSAGGTADWPHVGDAEARSPSANTTRNAAWPAETHRVPGRIITVGPLLGVLRSSSYASAHSGHGDCARREVSTSMGPWSYRAKTGPQRTGFRWPP